MSDLSAISSKWVEFDVGKARAGGAGAFLQFFADLLDNRAADLDPELKQVGGRRGSAKVA